MGPIYLVICFLLSEGVNSGKCLDNYGWYNPESWVYDTAGCLLPETRNALIRDKDNGYGFWNHHWRQVAVPEDLIYAAEMRSTQQRNMLSDLARITMKAVHILFLSTRKRRIWDAIGRSNEIQGISENDGDQGILLMKSLRENVQPDASQQKFLSQAIEV
ncbi:unnamed protein product, partial [Mesorhabditis belari]|uniref:Uncharacterized protein n=1 Tax=Mesorhabditis belari TaxID=2138241 RepID=A0AAF3ER88_9BILA